MGDRLRHLIIVVPGIGGSVLADAAGKRVWGKRRDVGSFAIDPDRLTLAEPLHPVGYVESAGFVPPFRLHGYEGLIRGLRNGLDTSSVVVDVATPGVPSYTPTRNADVVVMPYDFRQGVREAAEQLAREVGQRLGHLSDREKADRVIVIGHSMGGLVARYWAGMPGQARLCRAVLAVGTPHRGAPKALDWVVNGAAVGSGWVRDVTRARLSKVTDVLRGWPAMFDLLPTYKVIRAEDGTTLTPEGLPTYVAGDFVRGQLFGEGVARSAAVHEEIGEAWKAMEPDVRPLIFPFFARDHGTPHAMFMANGKLVPTDDDPDWQPNAGWRGDGTVPAVSAIPPELDGHPELHHPVEERHSPMASTSAVVAAVRGLTGDARSVERGTDPGERLRLGVDLDDLAAFGETVEVRARTIAPTDGDIAVWLTVQPADRSSPMTRVPMRRSDTDWSAPFIPRSPGLWSVSVQAVGRGLGSITIGDTVAVVDLDEPEMHPTLPRPVLDDL